MRADSKPTKQQIDAVQKLLTSKFGYKITTIISMEHALQKDTKSCGVLCCFYVYQLLTGNIY